MQIDLTSDYVHSLENAIKEGNALALTVLVIDLVSHWKTLDGQQRAEALEKLNKECNVITDPTTYTLRAMAL